MNSRGLPAETPGIRSSRLVLIALFLGLMAFTTPSPIGSDAYWYVLDIKASLGRPWTNAKPVWEFAHVLWRPLGRALSQIFLPIAAPRFGGDLQTAITFLLVCVSVVGAFVCVLTVHAAVWRLTRRPWISAFAAVSFLCLSPILNDSRCGSPYIAGLACSALALYFAAFRAPTWKTAALCGLLSGVAALLWVPFLISLPAVLAAGPILGPAREKQRFDFRWAAIVCGAAGVALASFYALAIAAAHISTEAGLVAWIGSESVNSRDRTLLRMATGMVRGFYDLGNDSVWFKWFVFRDPYAKVGVVDLLRAALAKVAMFYAALACLALVLWRSPMGRKLLLLTAIAALPHIAFALAFESGSAERYLPALPAVAMAFGYAAGSADIGRRERILIAVLFCLHIPANLISGQAAARQGREVAQRIALLNSLSPESRLYVVNLRDGLFGAEYGVSLHPASQRPLREVDVIVPSSLRSPLWRTDFSCSVLRLWDKRREAWISKRILASQPVRSWLWVEGDDPHVTWQAVHRFFLPFDRAEDIDGEDGFFLIPDTPENRCLLLASIPDANPRNCVASPAGQAVVSGG
jgi:hypothetical protein